MLCSASIFINRDEDRMKINLKKIASNAIYLLNNNKDSSGNSNSVVSGNSKEERDRIEKEKEKDKEKSSGKLTV